MKKTVLFFFLLGLPYTLIAQEMVNLHKAIIKAKQPEFTDEFEGGLYAASQFILTHHSLRGSKEYNAAEKIVVFWKDKKKWFELPLQSKFHESLQADYVWTFMNEVAQINYILTQKYFKNRVLKCRSSTQKKEVQLEAARLVLQYSINHKVAVPSETQKYLNAYQNHKLDQLF